MLLSKHNIEERKLLELSTSVEDWRNVIIMTPNNTTVDDDMPPKNCLTACDDWELSSIII